MKNGKRKLKALLSILICLILVFAAILGAKAREFLSLIDYNDGKIDNGDASIKIESTMADDEDMNFQTINDIQADSIKDLVKTWATNGGEKLQSKSVINVLLIGEDNDDGSHRSDSMILASVNTKTQTITLCSFLRDSYTYMEINGSERYDKTNHAYCWAGAAKVMEILSNNYKINIDHFVSIDFKSFEKVIDLLGGVTVPVTESEANYMNRTTKIKGFEAGDSVTLDGKHALVYSRIRKLDSEVERTRRQREVIASVAHNVKASSINEVNELAQTFLPYISTNYKKTEILSLASKALSEGWFNYTIKGMVEPSEDLRTGVRGFRTYTGNLDVWIVDYVRAAQEVQNALYGTTNIEIGPDHKSPTYYMNGNYSYDYEDNDGETSRYSYSGDSIFGNLPSYSNPFTRDTERSSTNFADRLSSKQEQFTANREETTRQSYFPNSSDDE